MTTPSCIAPWVSITLSGNGDIKPCCVYRGGSHSIHRGDTLESTWKDLDSIRSEFLKRQLPSECISCEKRSSTLGSSRADWYNTKVMNKPKVYRLDPEMDLRHIDLNFGNTCNLKCRMCGSWGSTAWFKEDRALMEIDQRFARSSISITHPTIIPANYWEGKRNLFKNLERIDFKGGEPFMQEGMYEFLEYLIDWGLSSQVTISYTTNGSKRPKQVEELFPYFKKINLAISVEAVGDLYKYIRGGEVQSIAEIEESVEWFSRFKNLKGGFNSAIQIYNVFGLEELWSWFDYIKSKYQRWTIPPVDCLVSEPKYLDINIMPDHLKKLASDRLSGRQEFSVLKQSLSRSSYNPEMWDMFKKFTNEIDKMRETSILDVLPELKDEFNG